MVEKENSVTYNLTCNYQYFFTFTFFIHILLHVGANPCTMLQASNLPWIGLCVICPFEGVRIRSGVVSVKVRLTKDLIESVRLLDSQESNTKDENQRADSHYHSIYSHGKQEQGDEKVHDIASSKCKEIFPNSRPFETRYHWCGGFNCHKEHDQTCYRN